MSVYLCVCVFVFAKSWLATGPWFPRNPLSTASGSAEGTAASSLPVAGTGSGGWGDVSMQAELDALDLLEEGQGPSWQGWSSDDEELPDAAGVVERPPRRPPALGPGGRRCIVAATCSSGAHLRCSRSNMLERSYSPLQMCECVCVCVCRCSHTADRNVPLICAASWFHGLYLCVFVFGCCLQVERGGSGVEFASTSGMLLGGLLASILSSCVCVCGQSQQHARAELISASVVATCSIGVTLRFRCASMCVCLCLSLLSVSMLSHSGP